MQTAPGLAPQRVWLEKRGSEQSIHSLLGGGEVGSGARPCADVLIDKDSHCLKGYPQLSWWQVSVLYPKLLTFNFLAFFPPRNTQLEVMNSSITLSSCSHYGDWDKYRFATGKKNKKKACSSTKPHIASLPKVYECWRHSRLCSINGEVK